MKVIKPSATLEINELSLKLATEGKKIFRLGFGQSPFPVPEKLVLELQKNAYQKDYLPVRGLRVLRDEIAQYFNRYYNLKAATDDILIGPGSKELLYNFQVVYNIEELLLPSPSWVSYEPQAHLTNHKVVWLATQENQRWKINVDTIEYHCKTKPKKKRTLIFNYPSNPLGITYSSDELKALALVFRKYEITVVADEIYGEVHHKGQHDTLAKYYPEATIISTGLSKWAGAGGWRLGVFVFPKELRSVLNAMAIVASETFTSTSSPIQYAAVQAYKSDLALEVYLQNSRRILEAIGQLTYSSLIDIGTTMPKPEGGFYLFPNFNKWRQALKNKHVFTSSQFCKVLLEETGVALLPGEAFGQQPDQLTARLSYVDFNGKELLDYLELNPNTELNFEFLEKYCPRIVEAINTIKLWILSL